MHATDLRIRLKGGPYSNTYIRFSTNSVKTF